jgi:hypothetical protein
MWIHPIVGLPFCVSTAYVKNVKPHFSLFGVAAIMIGAVSYIVTGKITTLLGCVLACFWLASESSRSNGKPNLWYAYSIIAIGVLSSKIFSFNLDERTGLLGNEINFSGYMVFIFWLIVLERRWNLPFCIILIVGCLVVTRSRAFLVSLGISCLLYIMRKKPFGLVFLFIAVFGVFMFNERIISELSHFEMFKSGGYTTGLDRLSKINDSSLSDRNELNKLWFEFLYGRWDVLIFGMNSSEYELVASNVISNVPHNDYIDKIIRSGVLYLAVCIIFMFLSIPMWMAISVLCYAFFLHSTISIPWVICIAANLDQVNKRPRRFSNVA